MTHQLKIGQPAPAFILPDGNQNNHSLSDYRGSWLVLFFYPKDLTPGCTAEACQFRDHYADIQANNSQILGINTDNSASHKHFIEKKQLPFSLLSDTNGETCRAYGSLFKLGPIKFSKRHTFIINPDGNIAKIYRKVSPDQHARQIIDDLKSLQERSVRKSGT
ncbi:peroxiredoxin [Methylomarinum sp. Ch1-1]|uniref:thioredoxin-dependent peroxiredoxin n=1 Tax=Methylomarinum roseum TaxID=3067653 RepID=A0AAU7NPF7_9GAMM